MHIPEFTWLSAIGGLLLAGSLPAAALEIYRWTDARGVVHFSDQPPADPHQAVQTLQLEPGPGTTTSRLDSVLEVAERLEASRLAREQARAEASRAAQPAAPVEPAPAPAPVIVYPFPRHPHLFDPDVKPPHRKPDQQRERRKPPPRALVPPVHDSATAWGDRR